MFLVGSLVGGWLSWARQMKICLS